MGSNARGFAGGARADRLRQGAGIEAPTGGRTNCTLDGLRELLHADIGFHGSDGSFATHAWHPFPAKFPPQLPGFFIEALSRPGDLVLDPMAGSGTTLVEAQRLGRRALGCDIDPLARLIAEVKLAPIDGAAADAAGRAVLDQARRDCRVGRKSLARELPGRFDRRTLAFVNYWFPLERQLELLALRKRIEVLSNDRLRRFLEMVLSSTVIAKSGGVSWARDLAHTRPHRVLDKPPGSAFTAFEKRLRTNLSRGQAPTNGPEATVLAAGAARTGVPSDSVDLIVTSPPYANNAIDYMRAHKFSLVWLGWAIGELTELRKGYLGHEALGTHGRTPLPDECEATLTALARLDARKAAVLRRYFGEMAAVLGEMCRVLRPGCAAIVVVGTSTLRGLDVRTHHGLAAIGETVGLVLAGMGTRRLDRDRRMMPARWGGSPGTGIEQRMHEEYAIGFVKP